MSTMTCPKSSRVKSDFTEVCNFCGSNADGFIKNMIGYTICEAEIKCPHCKREDYFAYGFFQSDSEGYNKNKEF